MSRAILHVDMDAFYASVEVLDNPELRGQPVIVGGRPGSRGVVAAASYEARKFGVHSAMSLAQAARLCPRGVFLPVRGRRYAEISTRVFEIFQHYTPLVEGLSLDEAFLDVTGSQRLFGPAEVIAQEIRRRVRQELGLACTVGLAPNKSLAKIASDLAKPDGFKAVAQEAAENFLAPLPVGRLWGVGEVTEKRLADLGVEKVGDLFKVPRETLERILGSYTETLLEMARGIDDRPVESEREPKSIGAETTFDADIADAAELRRVLDALAERVARELRAEGFRARAVTLKARYPDFTTFTRSKTLARPTAATRELKDAARELLEKKLDRRGRPLRLVGVSAHRLLREGAGQLELFPDPNTARAEKLDRAIDAVQKNFGKGAIKLGSQLKAKTSSDP